MISMINEGLKQIVSAVAKMLVHKKDEMGQEEVQFLVGHLVVRGNNL